MSQSYRPMDHVHPRLWMGAVGRLEGGDREHPLAGHDEEELPVAGRRRLDDRQHVVRAENTLIASWPTPTDPVTGSGG